MKTDEMLEKETRTAFKWEPLLRGSVIDVTANNGIVTITGSVDSLVKKLAAERAARNITGAKSVMERIEIEFKETVVKSDAEIANDVSKAFQLDREFPGDKLQIKVINGWVFLQGELQWDYQKDAASNAINHVAGVRGVTNHITISVKEISHPEVN